MLSAASLNVADVFHSGQDNTFLLFMQPQTIFRELRSYSGGVAPLVPRQLTPFVTAHSNAARTLTGHDDVRGVALCPVGRPRPQRETMDGRSWRP